MNNEVKSPCVAVCRDKSGVCIGCFRTAKEITEWYDANAARKIEIVKNAENRKIEFESY